MLTVYSATLYCHSAVCEYRLYREWEWAQAVCAYARLSCGAILNGYYFQPEVITFSGQ